MTACISGLRLGPQVGLAPVGFTSPPALAVVAALSEAAFVSLGTTVTVLSVAVAVGWLLQPLRSKPLVRAGATSQEKATEQELEHFIWALNKLRGM